MLYTRVIHPVYSFASPELGHFKFGVSHLEGARHTFQVTPVMPHQYINLRGNIISRCLSEGLGVIDAIGLWLPPHKALDPRHCHLNHVGTLLQGQRQGRRVARAMAHWVPQVSEDSLQGFRLPYINKALRLRGYQVVDVLRCAPLDPACSTKVIGEYAYGAL